MNRPDRLERDLTAWLADRATPRVPDFTDDILWLTARTRQRPRWSFPGLWLPRSVVTFSRRTVGPTPWRTIGLLAALALLIVAGIGFYVGSQPRLPPPFGLAEAGLVAYARGGDIYTVDMTTAERDVLVTGPPVDREPRWSLDGTRLAFLRAAADGDVLVIVDARSREVLATSDTFAEPDTDSIAWSPDGRWVTVGATYGGFPGLFTVDTTTGLLTPLPIDYLGLDAYWRPPDGRQLMFLGGNEPDVGLFMVDVDVGTVTEITGPQHRGDVRPSGWTPDGQRAVFTSGLGEGRLRTHVVDVTTRAEVTFDDVGHAHVSNDGSRMVGLTSDDRVCVADLSGGPCVPIGQGSMAYKGTHAVGAQWSPDDEWILIRYLSQGRPILIDPDGGELEQPSWIADGAESIQRLSP